MAAGFDTTSSQRRACSALGIVLDDAAAYHSAAANLEAFHAPGNGIPVGHTWRSAAKLTDAQLIAQFQSFTAALAVDAGSEPNW